MARASSHTTSSRYTRAHTHKGDKGCTSYTMPPPPARLTACKWQAKPEYGPVFTAAYGLADVGTWVSGKIIRYQHVRWKDYHCGNSALGRYYGRASDRKPCLTADPGEKTGYRYSCTGCHLDNGCARTFECPSYAFDLVCSDVRNSDSSDNLANKHSDLAQVDLNS